MKRINIKLKTSVLESKIVRMAKGRLEMLGCLNKIEWSRSENHSHLSFQKSSGHYDHDFKTSKIRIKCAIIQVLKRLACIYSHRNCFSTLDFSVFNRPRYSRTSRGHNPKSNNNMPSMSLSRPRHSHIKELSKYSKLP